MRDDLTKVLCEQPRSRSWDKYGNYRNLDKFERQYDDAFDEDDGEPFAGVGSGYREPMKYRFGYNAKSFGEHLSPLYGLLRKNVGRKWNKVYSELTRAFDTRSVTGNHILQHLYDQLAKPEQTFVGADGKVWIKTQSWRDEQPIAESYYEYYVDPCNGILKINRHKRTYRAQRKHDAMMKKRAQDAVLRVVDKYTELHLIEDVWFEVKFELFEGTRSTKKEVLPYSRTTIYRESIEYPIRYDVLQKRSVQANRVAISKRTISHKELKKYGLVI